MARRAIDNQTYGVSLLTPLFDRFESDRAATADDLARDLADILGARRSLMGRVPGVLGWGLPGLSGLAPNSDKDREEVASIITATINRFEPRLEHVRVTPVPGSFEFRFILEAELVQANDESVTLRILSPRRGGALGADIDVING